MFRKTNKFFRRSFLFLTVITSLVTFSVLRPTLENFTFCTSVGESTHAGDSFFIFLNNHIKTFCTLQTISLIEIFTKIFGRIWDALLLLSRKANFPVEDKCSVAVIPVKMQATTKLLQATFSNTHLLKIYKKTFSKKSITVIHKTKAIQKYFKIVNKFTRLRSGY